MYKATWFTENLFISFSRTLQWMLLYFEQFYTIYNICIRLLLIFVHRANTIANIHVCARKNIQLRKHLGRWKWMHEGDNYVDEIRSRWKIRWRYSLRSAWLSEGRSPKQRAKGEGKTFHSWRKRFTWTDYISRPFDTYSLPFEVPSAFEAKHLGLQLPSSTFFFFSLSPSSFDGPLF